MADENKEVALAFATVTPSGIIIPDMIDKKVSGTKWIKYGEDNKFPAYLWDNYLKCSNLQAIVNTISDYVCGNKITCDYSFLSDDCETLEEVIQKCIFDYILFGGFTVECIRNANNDIVRINYQNVMNVRVNEDLNKAYICSKWGNWTNSKVVELPLYDANELQPHFIFYYRGNVTRGIYPIPMYISSLKSIEILNNTRNFHLKNLENGFSARTIINLNNGNIKTRELQEIKEKLEEGYCGTENAGKFILLNGGDKEHETTIQKLDADNFGDLYRSLQESSVDDIYVAFRINPILLGKNGNTGFTQQEFEQAYKLYDATVISVIQNTVKKCFEKLGIVIDFEKFKIIWD